MNNQKQIEEIIRLINKGFDIESISFELGIPIDQLQEYEKRLNLRKSAKESISNGKISEAIANLKEFIKNSEDNIIEKAILLKLSAYINKTVVDEEQIRQLDEERKKLGLLGSIDDILNELGVQIPRRKSSNTKKAKNKNTKIQQVENNQNQEEPKKCKEEKENQEEQEKNKETNEEEKIEKSENKKEKTKKTKYEMMINRYKSEIASNPQRSHEKRRLLSYVYFKAGKIDEAIEELELLIKQAGSPIAYLQLIYTQKKVGNFEDAKLWAYEALDKFPKNIEFREQLISIAKTENDEGELVEQLKQLIAIDPDNENAKKMLKTFKENQER